MPSVSLKVGRNHLTFSYDLENCCESADMGGCI